MKTLVSGSIAYDYIMDFPDYFKNHILPDKIHQLSVSFLIDDLKINFGGTAGNIAYNLVLLGESPTIISTAGYDFEKYKRWLLENGIDFSNIKIIGNELTAVAHIITDRSDNQITAFYPGSMKYPFGEIAPELLKDAMAIVAPGFAEDMKKNVEIYKKNNIPFIYDPGQQITSIGKDDLIDGMTGAKALICNDYEFSLIMNKTGLGEKNILDKVEILAVTLGEKGSAIKTKKEAIDIPPAKPDNIKDPTGAGDAYRAGFIKGLIEGWPMEKTGKVASVISTFAISEYGTQNHSFGWDDIKRKYQTNYREEL